MAIFTIAGLTLKEAIRRRTLIGSFLLGLLVLGVSLLLILIRARLLHNVETKRWNLAEFAMQYSNSRGIITLMCLFTIRIMGSLFAILLAGGSISGEIEQGLLSVIIPKPIWRWQILLGKWIGINIVLTGSVLLWTVFVWASLTFQSHAPDQHLIFYAGFYSIIYPVVISTLTLALSTVTQRVLGSTITLIMAGFSWADGMWNFLGTTNDVPFLNKMADFAGLLVPQGYVAWRIRETTEDIVTKNLFAETPVKSSRLLQEWGSQHLHFVYLDMVYIAFYIVVVLILGAILFQRREVS